LAKPALGPSAKRLPFAATEIAFSTPAEGFPLPVKSAALLIASWSSAKSRPLELRAFLAKRPLLTAPAKPTGLSASICALAARSAAKSSSAWPKLSLLPLLTAWRRGPVAPGKPTALAPLKASALSRSKASLFTLFGSGIFAPREIPALALCKSTTLGLPEPSALALSESSSPIPKLPTLASREFPAGCPRSRF
jgi:hypothetical protein